MDSLQHFSNFYPVQHFIELRDQSSMTGGGATKWENLQGDIKEKNENSKYSKNLFFEVISKFINLT